MSKKKKQRKKNLSKKTGVVSEKLNFTDTESDPSDGYATHNLGKRSKSDDEMVSFDNTTVKFIQRLYFHRNVFNFVLCCIQSYDDKIAAMNKRVDENPSYPRWDF